MIYLKYAVISVLAVSLLTVLVCCFKSKKPFKAIILNILVGLVSLTVLNLTSKLSGVYLPINLHTVLGSSVYGIPAICGFLILKLIFI